MATSSYPPPRSAATYKANYKKLMTHIDLLSNGCRASSWLESMKASSPTHMRSITDIDWTRGHPSALGKFEEIAATTKGKKIVMFLDYDGTLSPIVEDPDSSFMSDLMRATVKSVAKYFPTAILTGRSLDKAHFFMSNSFLYLGGRRYRNLFIVMKAFSFVQIEELFYAGSHGMDSGKVGALLARK